MQLTPQNLIPLVAIVAPFVVAVIALFGWIIVSTTRTRERERTRREVAAYVAEGTISVESAERLLAEHTLDAERERTRRTIAASVAEGFLSADDAERLISADKPAWERPEAWGCSPRRSGAPRARRAASGSSKEESHA